MSIDITPFRAPQGKSIKLAEWATRVDSLYTDKENYKDQLKDNVEALSDLQRMLYADNEYSLLIIFQAMDAAGKDGAIRHVLSGINPQGCQVFSFKKPSAQELDHDFLWRTTRCLPERGRIGVFNRSYYEEVLVVRVHPAILQGQAVPEDLIHPDTVWQERFRSIRDLEKHLHRNGTKIVKFFLHLSKEEQRQRFIARIDEPEKHWKFSEADIKERGYWDDYMHAYEEAIGATSTQDSPWYIVPADDKKNSRLIISQVLRETLEGLNINYPAQTPERVAELEKIRKQLEKST